MDSDEAGPISDGSSTPRGLPRAATFVLECLEKLPEPFQVTLGQPTLLQPVVEVTLVEILHMHVEQHPPVGFEHTCAIHRCSSHADLRQLR